MQTNQLLTESIVELVVNSSRYAFLCKFAHKEYCENMTVNCEVEFQNI